MQGSSIGFWSRRPGYQHDNTPVDFIDKLGNGKRDPTPRQFRGYYYQFDFPFAGRPEYILGLFHNANKFEELPKDLQAKDPKPSAVKQWLALITADIQNNLNINDPVYNLLPYFSLALPIATVRNHDNLYSSQLHENRLSDHQISQIRSDMSQTCQTLQAHIMRQIGMSLANYASLMNWREDLATLTPAQDDDKRGILCVAKAAFDRGLKLQKRCDKTLQTKQPQVVSKLSGGPNHLFYDLNQPSQMDYRDSLTDEGGPQAFSKR